MSALTLKEGDSTFEMHCAPDGSGDFLVSVEVAVDGFAGHADGHVVGSDWLAFTDAVARLEQTRKGEARFGSAIQGRKKGAEKRGRALVGVIGQESALIEEGLSKPSRRSSFAKAMEDRKAAPPAGAAARRRSLL